MSLGKWMLAVGLVAASAGTSSAADVGFSIGVGGPRSSFGFSYNQPGWGGRHHHHHHGGRGSHYSVGLYAAPRYYPTPRYVYAPTVVVPAPTYIVQPAPVIQYQATAPVQYPTTAPVQYPASAPSRVPASPGRLPPPAPQPPTYSPDGY